MGANAQTSVPTFTAGEVLTAANMNISARTGIPVFADETARNAGFGGTGEKVLAEGQFAYLEDSNTTQYYDGAAWQSVASSLGLVKQIVTGSYDTQVTSSSATYADTNLTATITPTSASSKVLVFVTHADCFKQNNTALNLKLFRGATELILFSKFGGYSATSTTANFGTCATVYLDSPATTSATTYKTQLASQSAIATVGVNEATGKSSIVLVEILL